MKLSIFSYIWCHLYVFFGEVFVHVLCPFLLDFYLCDVDCMSFLYILDVNPLLELLFANIISHLVGCLLVWLAVSFAVQSFWVCREKDLEVHLEQCQVAPAGERGGTRET